MPRSTLSNVRYLLNLAGLSALKTLSVRNNRLGELPVEISLLRSLRVLNLAGNRLHTMPLGIFKNNSTLQTLDVSSNQLRKVSTKLAMYLLLSMDLVFCPMSQHV
jgi:Leucine-rich repeat (LRR) protein